MTPVLVIFHESEYGIKHCDPQRTGHTLEQWCNDIQRDFSVRDMVTRALVDGHGQELGDDFPCSLSKNLADRSVSFINYPNLTFNVCNAFPGLQHDLRAFC